MILELISNYNKRMAQRYILWPWLCPSYVLTSHYTKFHQNPWYAGLLLSLSVQFLSFQSFLNRNTKTISLSRRVISRSHRLTSEISRRGARSTKDAWAWNLLIRSNGAAVFCRRSFLHEVETRIWRGRARRGPRTRETPKSGLARAPGLTTLLQ